MKTRQRKVAWPILVPAVITLVLLASCGGGFLFDRPEDGGSSTRTFEGPGDNPVLRVLFNAEVPVEYSEELENTQWATAEVELEGGTLGANGVELDATAGDHIRIHSIGGMGFSAATVAVVAVFPDLYLNVDNAAFLSISMSSPGTTFEAKILREFLGGDEESVRNTIRVGGEWRDEFSFSDDLPDLPDATGDHSMALSSAFFRDTGFHSGSQILNDSILGEGEDYRIDTITVAPFNIHGSDGADPGFALEDPLPARVREIYLFDYVLTPEQIADLAGP